MDIAKEIQKSVVGKTRENKKIRKSVKRKIGEIRSKEKLQKETAAGEKRRNEK